MVELKSCPNPECGGGKLRMDKRGVPNEDFMFIWCEGCGTQGPSAQKYSEAQRLWNALPRQDGELVAMAEEFYSLSLVIEAAVRRESPNQHPRVLALVKQVTEWRRAALARCTGGGRQWLTWHKD